MSSQLCVILFSVNYHYLWSLKACGYLHLNILYEHIIILIVMVSWQRHILRVHCLIYMYAEPSEYIFVVWMWNICGILINGFGTTVASCCVASGTRAPLSLSVFRSFCHTQQDENIRSTVCLDFESTVLFLRYFAVGTYLNPTMSFVLFHGYVFVYC